MDSALEAFRKPEAYAALFRLNHVERTLFGRYRLDRLPDGAFEPLISGLKRWLNLSDERVARLLKALRARRAGRPFRLR